MVLSYVAVKSIEKPSYDILEVRNWYELREYKDYIVAEVEIQWEREEAINKWFRILAWYIFWGNEKKESISMTSPVNDIEKKSVNISMTAPVNDIKTKNNTHIVQFVLPSKYTLETLPVPSDSRVQIRKVEWYTAAAIKYTLWATESKIKGYQYNPPLSFPLMRRNEVIAEVQ